MVWILIQLPEKSEGLATTSTVGMVSVEKKNLSDGGPKVSTFM
jgi:hypothetical protein